MSRRVFPGLFLLASLFLADAVVVGRLVAVTNALNQVTRYEYNELGEQTAQVDASGCRYADQSCGCAGVGLPETVTTWHAELRRVVRFWSTGCDERQERGKTFLFVLIAFGVGVFIVRSV